MDTLKAAAELLLKKAGFASDSIVYTPLAGGRNNRVYRLDTPAGPFLLKQYYRGGDWDRLAAESRFLRFCEMAGVGRVPRLAAEDEEKGLAIHSWFEGLRPEPEQALAADADEAAAFVGDLARAAEKRDLSAMPPARDACLCLEDCFRSPRERVEQLEMALLADPDGPCAREAKIFFRDALRPAWERAQGNALAGLTGMDLSRLFPPDALLASPSDFGYHNALRLAGGGLGFVDFEYAGLDSPIKLIGDFVCQADFPQPETMRDRLAGAVCRGDPARTAELAEQVRILLPLFRVKFCCIILNEFKNPDALRRDFARPGEPFRRLDVQLRKAESYIRGT